MFEVRTSSPLDDAWEDRDRRLAEAAGRPSDFSGAGCGPDGPGTRDHGWVVATFAAAHELRARLAAVPAVTATIREA